MIIDLRVGPFGSTITVDDHREECVALYTQETAPCDKWRMLRGACSTFVDYMVQDFRQPLGVAAYKTSKDMSEELLRALPDIEDLKRLLESTGK